MLTTQDYKLFLDSHSGSENPDHFPLLWVAHQRASTGLDLTPMDREYHFKQLDFLALSLNLEGDAMDRYERFKEHWMGVN